MNTLGTLFRLTDFGESHGTAIGGVIDGMPAGMTVDFDEIQHQLDRRKPGQSSLTTARKESDEVQFLSGFFEGRTTGTPIGFIIPNSDSRSKDYENVRHAFRPNHADFTYTAKYGIRDHRGGGRSSARETAVRVVGGALARQALATRGITLRAYAIQIGTTTNPEMFEQEILTAKAERDSVGGVIECIISGVQPGLGEPVFGKLQAMLASAMMSINAAKGFEYGDGFKAAGCRGSQQADIFHSGEDGRIHTRTNHSGGIQGGISNGEDIVFRVAFKPVATLPRPLETIDDEGRATTLEVTGRHDPCVIPRAIPVVEAMAAMTILDALLLHESRYSFFSSKNNS